MPVPVLEYRASSTDSTRSLSLRSDEDWEGLEMKFSKDEAALPVWGLSSLPPILGLGADEPNLFLNSEEALDGR